MNNIKVSIVTVVFNDFHNIESTIISVLSQSYTNVEYIIIDGGSTDGTVEIIKRYISKINFFISEPDRGIYDAMNKGTRISTGNWICYMNSGDIFTNSDVVSTIFNSKILNSCFNIGVIYSDVITDFNSKQVFRKAKPLTQFYRGICFSHQSLFVSTLLAKKYPFDIKYSISADYDFLYNLYSKNVLFEFIDNPIAIVDITKGASKEVNLIRLYKDFFEISKKYSEWYLILFLYIIVPFEYLYAILLRLGKKIIKVCKRN